MIWTTWFRPTNNCWCKYLHTNEHLHLHDSQVFFRKQLRLGTSIPFQFAFNVKQHVVVETKVHCETVFVQKKWKTKSKNTTFTDFRTSFWNELIGQTKQNHCFSSKILSNPQKFCPQYADRDTASTPCTPLKKSDEVKNSTAKHMFFGQPNQENRMKLAGICDSMLFWVAKNSHVFLQCSSELLLSYTFFIFRCRITIKHSRSLDRL